MTEKERALNNLKSASKLTLELKKDINKSKNLNQIQKVIFKQYCEIINDCIERAINYGKCENNSLSNEN